MFRYSEKLSPFSGSFSLTSTIYGFTIRIASAVLSAVRPPARTIFLFSDSPLARCQLKTITVPPDFIFRICIKNKCVIRSFKMLYYFFFIILYPDGFPDRKAELYPRAGLCEGMMLHKRKPASSFSQIQTLYNLCQVN